MRSCARRWSRLGRGAARSNAARAEQGLQPLEHTLDQGRSAARMLVMTSRAFDFLGPLPPTVVHVGPRLDDGSWAGDWEPLAGEEPWSSSVSARTTKTRPICSAGSWQRSRPCRASRPHDRTRDRPSLDRGAGQRTGCKSGAAQRGTPRRRRSQSRTQATASRSVARCRRSARLPAHGTRPTRHRRAGGARRRWRQARAHGGTSRDLIRSGTGTRRGLVPRGGQAHRDGDQRRNRHRPGRRGDRGSTRVDTQRRPCYGVARAAAPRSSGPPAGEVTAALCPERSSRLAGASCRAPTTRSEGQSLGASPTMSANLPASSAREHLSLLKNVKPSPTPNR